MSVDLDRVGEAPAFRPFPVRVLQTLPVAMRGKARLARLMLDRDSGPLKLRHRDGAQLIVPSLRDSIGWHLLIDGIYEPAEQALMCRLLLQGGVFIDVGANVGVHAIPIAMRMPGLQVLAVEASEATLGYLRANVALNQLQTRITVVPCAAGAEEGESGFVEADQSRFGQGALSANAAEGTQVRVRRLDDIVRDAGGAKVGVIKIDVEGHELEVLTGARQILSATQRPWVVFEFHGEAEQDAGHGPGAAQEFLIGLGYRLRQLSSRGDRLSDLTAPLRAGFATLLAVPPGERIADGQVDTELPRS
jgi:FkbM family methyltransferase